ncbi:MAG TPA: acyl-CoA dehydrogenase family protein [Candidatus Cybelea sp.]|nr:acyl-CoA dehydrogenase family protein [Candidatus Cybelea sp.]
MTAYLTRTIFNEEHHLFRDQVRRFMEREVVPNHGEWEEDGKVSRDVWLKAGAAGLLCTVIPEEYGGVGADRFFSAIIIEEISRAGASGLGFNLHSDIMAPYILNYGSEEQKRAWLPKMTTGEVIGAIAMTEPGAGSDLQGVRTTAVREGNHLVINGQKTFITNGQLADLVVVVAKTDPAQGAKGMSLVLVEAGTPGFTKGRNLHKVGLKAQDTSELFFSDVRVPITNLLGEEGKGFKYLMQELAWERLQVAIRNVAMAEAALDHTIAYTRERKAFGHAIADFQNSRFRLAECKTEVQIARAFVDHCLALVVKRELDAASAAMAKLFATETSGRVIDECLQLHGGYGYMWEYPIARFYADARVQRIFGGTSEIMKEIVARTL